MCRLICFLDLNIFIHACSFLLVKLAFYKINNVVMREITKMNSLKVNVDIRIVEIY